MTPHRAARLEQVGDRGATATELAVLMPALILLVLLPVQVGLWWHARQAADVAAEEALDAAQIAGATAADGQAGAGAILGQAGNLTNVTVDVNRTADDVTVTVRGDLGFSIFPGAWSVTARAEGPVERFIPENQR
ncbi:MAG: TadE family protein [Actinomycetota bacterium]|nr:TadE family protein [Actinomycetota bacterium]